MKVQWFNGENGFKDLVDSDTGNVVLSTNLDVLSFAKFDLDIEDLKIKYEQRQNEEIEAVEIVPHKKLYQKLNKMQDMRRGSCEQVHP